MFNVLIVEDDADIRILLGEQLQDKGCHVWRSSNGASALRRITEKLPDIIFVDIMMPVMDGIDLITELQESPETADIPVVLVTAVSTPEVTLRAIELGVKYRLTKPWEQRELDYVFEKALGLNSGQPNLPASRK